MKRPGLLLLLIALAWPPVAAMLTPSGLAPAPDPGWRDIVLLLRSLLLAGGTTLTSAVLGLACAWALAHHNLPFRAFLKALLLVPFLIPPYFEAVAWLNLHDLSGSVVATSIILGFCYFPLVLFPCLTALERISGGLEESGLIALGPRTTWKCVLWPLSAPFALAGAALVWMLTLVEYGVPSLMGVNTYSQEVFALVQGYHDYAAAGRACLPLLLCGLLPGLLVLYWGFPRMRRLTLPQTSRPVHRTSPHPHLLLLLPLAVAGVTLGVPLYSLLEKAHRLTIFQIALWEAGGDLLSSLQLAGLATLTALVLGAWLGLRGGRVWAGAALLTLTIPPILSGLGWIATVNRLGLGSSNLLLVWGLAARFLALPACLIALSSEATPPSQLEAGRLIPNRFRAHYITSFSLHRKAWGMGLALTFALAMGDLSLSLLLVDPGTSTLSVRIFNLHHYGRADLVSALCLIHAMVVVTPLAVGLCLEGE